MLTISQRKTFDFIKKYINKNQIAPTISEIAKGINITSRGVVHRYIQALAAEGKLEIIPNRRRNIRLKEESSNKVLLTGKFVADKAIEPIDKNHNSDISKIISASGCYGLKVVGDSMVQEGIVDGDIIICEPCNEADNNQIILVVINNQGTVLKRYQKNIDGTVTLLPIHSRLLPQVYPKAKIEIKAKFIGLLRLNND